MLPERIHEENIYSLKHAFESSNLYKKEKKNEKQKGNHSSTSIQAQNVKDLRFLFSAIIVDKRCVGS